MAKITDAAIKRLTKGYLKAYPKEEPDVIVDYILDVIEEETGKAPSRDLIERVWRIVDEAWERKWFSR